MNNLNEHPDVNRTNLWHKFEQNEAIAYVKSPPCNRPNVILILKEIVSLGTTSGVLTKSDIVCMGRII